MRIYLDVCCINRPFDDERQDRIRLEAEAVLRRMDRIHRGEHVWMAGEAMELEVMLTPDPERRSATLLLMATATERPAISAGVERRA